MYVPRLRSLLLGLALPLTMAFVMALAVPVAQAQDNHTGPVVMPKPVNSQKLPPPPALPGAALGQDRVTPAEKSNNDMPPNDALFDSVNRGDIISARDALSRGADPNATNILGLSALEQSIDLGRNDITFLLISLRGGSPSGPPSIPTKGKPPTVKITAEPKPAPPPRRLSVSAEAVVPPTSPYKAVPGPSGNPAPQAGFLGFGG